MKYLFTDYDYRGSDEMHICTSAQHITFNSWTVAVPYAEPSILMELRLSELLCRRLHLVDYECFVTSTDVNETMRQ